MTVVAIDFGTSNTVICTQDPITLLPRTLKFDRLSRRFETPEGQTDVVPSLVYVQGQDALVFGEAVRSQRLGFAKPDRLFKFFKRQLVEVYRSPDRQLDGTVYTVESIAEQFLQAIWQQLQPLQPSCVIFTVPVGAFDRYLDWFRDVTQRLEIPAVKLVDESTAAALGYAVQAPGSLVLVVDFGGGTLDLSLVRTTARYGDQSVIQAEVIAKSDAYVGGMDIDTWIAEHYLRQSGSSREDVQAVGWQNLLELAERMKIRLSTALEAKESWFDDENFIAHDLHLTQGDLTEILESHQLLEQLRQALDEVLGMALSKGVAKQTIEQVLLVGGSCQIPAIQHLVVSYFGKQRVRLDRPFEAVAYGALVLGQAITIEDYLRHSYAIRLWEPDAKTYSYLPIFNQGMQYPCQSEEPLTLQVAREGQSEIRLDIGEIADLAEAEVSFDAQGRMTSSHLNHRLAFRSLDNQQREVCVAHLNPPGEAGVDRIEVLFAVDEQRVLLATIKDLLTGTLLVEQGAIVKLK